MGSVLIEGGCVVAMDAARRRWEDGAVLVRDGAIAAVGARAEVARSAAAADVAERIDARGCIVVPGFVNTHQHHWYNLFKGLGGGLLLERWLAELQRPAGSALTPADLEAASRLACLEMVGGGTTTCLNHSVTTTGHDEVDATLRPVVESGMRQVFAKEVRPDGLAEGLALAEEVHRRWDGAAEGRVRVGFVVETSAHWVAIGACSEELVCGVDALARRLGARISDHVAGGTRPRDGRPARTDVEFLHQLGVLGEPWLLAHVLNVYDGDVELIADSGAPVLHTPTSESLRGGGIPPVRGFLDAGVRVALGSDGPMVDTSVDMVEQMKATIMLQNQLRLEPQAIGCEQALAMATIEGAAALGLDGELGSLEVGKRADVAVFDLDTPHAAPAHDPLAALVQSARGSDARWVLVDGVPLVRDGAFARCDRDEVRAVVAEARARVGELLARADVPAARPRLLTGRR